MTYDLVIGDYAYSSWSLRAWLLFEKFEIPRQETLLDFHSDASVEAQMAEFSPARTVPTIRTPEGAIVSESLAIAEELATRHADKDIWPAAPKSRAIARNIAAEMHASFFSLRAACPMNLRTGFDWKSPSDAVLADVARIERLWAWAKSECPDGPWLFGAFGAVDAMYAPVAARLAGYNLPMSQSAQDYVNAHLSDPAFRRWRAMGMVRGAHLSRYDQPHATMDWPGPKLQDAKPTDDTPVNANCPYSGKPSTHMLSLNGQTYGFCNAFCRDKTVVDPEAWPDFMNLVAQTQ